MQNKPEINETEILAKFRSNLQDILTPEYTAYTDDVLMRWLRAQNFNLKEVEKVFRYVFYNRITFDLNDILDNYENPQVLQNYEIMSMIGFAKDGSSIRYAPAGQWDAYGIMMSASCCQVCRYFIHKVESDIKALKEESLKTKKECNGITFIVDLAGFSIQQILNQDVIEFGSDYARLFQECYPGMCKNVLVINAPLIFEKIFRIFKPVIHHDLFDKMKVVGKGSSRALLLKYIDEDVLPEFLGGIKVDSNDDPYCKEYISFGGKVPEKFYSSKCRIPILPTDPGVTSAVISPRSVYNYPIVAKKGNTRVRLEYRLENGSLWVVVLYKEFGANTENPELPGPHEHIDENDENCEYKQMSVTLRSQTHCCQENAILVLKWPGIYIIKHANSGSWFTPRKMFVRHTILPPKV